jgi:hypothetical protein
MQMSLKRTVMTISVLIFAMAQVKAAIVSTPVGVTIISYYAFSDYGTGDVAFQVSNQIPGCEGGYWLRPSDGGFKTVYATMMASYMTKAPVYVYAYDDQLWSGSSAHFCRVYAIMPLPQS